MATATQLERDRMADELDDIKTQLGTLTREVADMRGDVRFLRQMLESEGQRCAFREKIAEAVAVIPRVAKLEDRLVQLEIKAAGMAAIVALVTAIITTLVTGAIKP